MNKCKVENCNNSSDSKKEGRAGYCNKHYRQLRRCGRILERTKKDLNEIIIKNKHAEIILYNIRSKEINRTLIDIDDVNKIKDYKWSIISNGYVVNKKFRLHRLIMNAPNNKDVDHINHNKLDNRKENLRVCDRSQNSMNRKVKGYDFDKRRKKFRVRIFVNGKENHIGYFEKEGRAIKAREEAEKKYFGEFRYNLNNKKSSQLMTT